MVEIYLLLAPYFIIACFCFILATYILEAEENFQKKKKQKIEFEKERRFYKLYNCGFSGDIKFQYPAISKKIENWFWFLVFDFDFWFLVVCGYIPWLRKEWLKILVFYSECDYFRNYFKRKYNNRRKRKLRFCLEDKLNKLLSKKKRWI